MLEIRHWLFKGQGSLQKLQSLSFVVTFIVYIVASYYFKSYYSKLLVQLYDTINVLGLIIFCMDSFIKGCAN